MNKLEVEHKNNRLLYRELFLKAQKDFKNKINGFKIHFKCKKNCTCCKLRYSVLSPNDIYKLKCEKETIAIEYSKLFLPYGCDENFDYETNNFIDIKKNQNLAKLVNEEYVNEIIKKTQEPVFFYFCKFLNENKCDLPFNQKSDLCQNYPSSVTTILPEECIYKEWQKLSLDIIKNDIGKDILTKLKEIDLYRSNFSCKRTGTCCKLASSEFSYEELKEKAKNGDNFATQFTSVFVPYESIDEARKIFPEYIELVEAKLDKNEQIYYYYCPKLTKDNLCSDYENRPGICKDFPNHSLAMLPPNCGFCEWKDDVEVPSMILHAWISISEFYIEKIEAILK